MCWVGDPELFLGATSFVNQFDNDDVPVLGEVILSSQNYEVAYAVRKYMHIHNYLGRLIVKVAEPGYRRTFCIISAQEITWVGLPKRSAIMKKFTFSLIIQTTEMFEVLAETEEEARDLLNGDGGYYFVETCQDTVVPPGVDYVLEQEEEAYED